MIEATYTLTEAEYCESMMLVLRDREPGQFRKRRLLIAWASVFALVIPAIPFYFWLKFAIPIWAYSPLTLLSSLAFMIYLIYTLHGMVTFRALKKRLRKLFQQSLEGQTNVHLRIDDSGWHDETPGTGTSFVEWNAFSKSIESDTMFLVLRRTPAFQMLPKRVLTAIELAQLRDLVSRHISAPSAQTESKI